MNGEAKKPHVLTWQNMGMLDKFIPKYLLNYQHQLRINRLHICLSYKSDNCLKICMFQSHHDLIIGAFCFLTIFKSNGKGCPRNGST